MSREDDEAAVGEVLLAQGSAFRELNADHLANVYADDADFTNAFGTSVHGGEKIVAYLRDLFANPNFASGKPVRPPDASIRFVGDDVAVVKTYIEREGQQTSEGEKMAVRRNHSLKVLERQDDGWRVVSELYMDAREDTTLPPKK